jgi:hypothetical protein
MSGALHWENFLDAHSSDPDELHAIRVTDPEKLIKRLDDAVPAANWVLPAPMQMWSYP